MSDLFRRYYIQNVMPRVNTMLLAVIGIGVLTLSLKYVRLVTGNPDVLLNESFWKRVALLVLVIVFAAYNALAYYAYADVEEERIPRVHRPMRVFALFLLDLLQITFSACMFGVMYIEDPVEVLGSEACRANAAGQACLAIEPHSVAMIFGLGALWHATVVMWYIVAKSLRDRNVVSHGGFSLIYLLLVVANTQIGYVGDWLAIILLAAVIGLVYRVQGTRWLRGDAVQTLPRA